MDGYLLISMYVSDVSEGLEFVQMLLYQCRQSINNGQGVNLVNNGIFH